MKKVLCILMVVVLCFGMAACSRGGNATAAADASGDYKIGIITGTVSQGEEEFRAAENMKKLYGDKIITATYPDNFTTETETVISQVLSLASDPLVKVIIFVQAVPGASAAIDKTRETRPDMVFIAGVPGEDPAVIASKADIVFQPDELTMGRTIVEQAKDMGAKTLVHYSFPRHMSYALLAARRDILKETCAKEGLEFVDATAPDPTGESGVAGAQAFILEDVPRKIAEYGADTAFFSTNCSMQEPLIKQVLAGKGVFPQQCCPSPYHAYPGALSIEIPAGKEGDVPFMLEQISTKVKEGGNSGRMATWNLPVNMFMIEAGVKYAIEYSEGRTNGKLDDAVLRKVMTEVAGSDDAEFNTYNEDGVKLDNYYFLLCPYVRF